MTKFKTSIIILCLKTMFCYCFVYYIYPSSKEMYWCSVVTKLCLTLSQSQGRQPARLLCPWDFPGKNTGASCHFLLQGIFLTHGSNLHLLLWQEDSLLLSHLGSPLINPGNHLNGAQTETYLKSKDIKHLKYILNQIKIPFVIS